MKKSIFPLLKSWLNRGKEYLMTMPILIWVNAIAIVVLSVLSIYAKVKSKGSGIESLFSDPFYYRIFYLGWLTSISEILWCTAISICLFSIFLLPASSQRFKLFLSASTVVMLLLFLDDRFRLTLILCVFFGTCKVVKLSVYTLYGLLLIAYAWLFRYTIKKTPYVPLLASFCLFGFSSAIDIAPIASRGVHAMLEDGTKLVGLINLTIYFWWICQQEIKQKIARK